MLLLVVALLGCGSREPGQIGTTDSSSEQSGADIPYAPAQVKLEADEALDRNMELLGGELKEDTVVLVSMDASATIDKMLEAVEKKDQRKLAQYEQMGWLMSVAAGDRFLAMHADDFPYVRIQLESGNFEGRRGFIHKKYLKLDDSSVSLRRFTSNRGEGDEWRSR